MATLHAPRRPTGRLRSCLLGGDLAGGQEPAEEAGGGAELSGGLGDGQPVALGRDGDVRHLRSRRGDELFACERVLAFEQRPEVVWVDLALKSHLSGERADPSTWGLAVSEVVVLGGEGDLADVVVSGAATEAADVQHGTAP